MQEIHHEFQAMSCAMEVIVHAADAVGVAAVLARVEAETYRIEALYSRYRSDSIVSRINRAAGGAPLAVDAETAGLLDFAADCHQISDGLFDITSGVLRQLWRPGLSEMPSAAARQSICAQIGWERVRWQAPYIALPDAGMEIDLGGLGKEYAADRAATLLRAAGIGHALINFGGDLHAVGPRGDGSPWLIGIRDPFAAGRIVARLPLLQGGLATSGDYERAIVINGVRYPHLLDPRSGLPAHGLSGVSVLAGSTIAAGALASTALLKGGNGIAFLEQSGASWLAVDAQGLVRTGRIA